MTTSGNQYLGSAFGIGALVDERGGIAELWRNAQSVRLRETTSGSLKLTSGPRFAGRTATPGPNHVAFAEKLRYEFKGSDKTRSLTLDTATDQLRVEDTPVDPQATAELLFRNDGNWHQEDAGTAVAILSSTASASWRVVMSGSPSSSLEIAEGRVRWSAPHELALDVRVEPISAFAGCVVIAGTLEMAAVLSSCFHDPDRYLPVFLVEGSSESRVNQQLSLETTRQSVGADHFVFGGATHGVIEDFLWDKSPEFRRKTRVFASIDDIAADPKFGLLPQFPCPSQAIPLGVLAARRQGRRLVIDDAAPAPSPGPVAGSVVSYERADFEGLVAANLAHFQRATLVAARTPTSAELAEYEARVADLQPVAHVAPEPIVVRRVAGLQSLVRRMTELDVDGVTDLTAFTTGVSYGLAYDVPVAHVLTPGAHEAVLRDLVRNNAWGNGLPLSLLVDTLDFGKSEIEHAVASIAEVGPTIWLSGERATKAEMFALMTLLPLSLQVIVAHGAADPDKPHEGISGIQLRDGLFTPESLRNGGLPVRAGIVVNNGCATWTSLARAFAAWGALGYIGTLWPVLNESAVDVGLRFMTGDAGCPVAQILFDGTRHLCPVDELNYGYVGLMQTKLRSVQPPLDEAQQLFASIVLIETHVQAVVAHAPESIMELLTGAFDALRLGFHQRLLDLDDTYAPFLARFRADLLALRRTRGWRTWAVDELREALRLIDELPESGNPVESVQIGQYRSECQESLVDDYLAREDYDAASAVVAEMRRASTDDANDIVRTRCLAAAFMVAVGRGAMADAEAVLAEISELGVATDAAFGVLDTMTRPSSFDDVFERHDKLAVASGSATGNLALHLAAAELFTRAERLRDTGRWGESLEAYRRVLEFFEATGAAAPAAQTHNNLGIVLRILGDESARGHFETALEIKRRLGQPDIGNSLLHLAQLTPTDDAKAAVRAYDAAVDAFRAAHDNKGLAEALLGKADLQEATGNAELAADTLTAALAAAQDASAWLAEGQIKVRLGRLTSLQGQTAGLGMAIEGSRLLEALGAFTEELDDGKLASDYWAFLTDHRAESSRAPAALYAAVSERFGAVATQSWLVTGVADLVRRGETSAAALRVALAPEAFDDRTLAAVGRAPRESPVAVWRQKSHELRVSSNEAEIARVNWKLGTALKEAGDAGEGADVLETGARQYDELGDRSTWAQVIIDAGNAWLDAGNITRAERCFQEGCAYYEAAGNHPVLLARAYNNIGYLHQSRREWHRAIEYYAKSIAALGDERDAVAVLARVNTAESAAAVGDVDRMATALTEVMRLTEDTMAITDPERRWRNGAAINSALLHAQHGNASHALMALGEAVALSARRLDWEPVSTALAFFALHVDEASWGLSPASRRSLIAANALVGQHDPACVSYVRSAAFRRVNSWDALFDEVAVIRKRDPALAARFTDEVIALEPANFRAHMGRGLSLSELKRYPEAEAEYSWCREARPEDPVPWNNLAHDALRQGHLESALRRASRAVELEPNYLDAWEAKAHTHIRLGQMDEGVAAMRRCVALSKPGSDRRREYQGLIRSIGLTLATAHVDPGRGDGAPRGG